MTDDWHFVVVTGHIGMTARIADVCTDWLVCPHMCSGHCPSRLSLFAGLNGLFYCKSAGGAG